MPRKAVFALNDVCRTASRFNNRVKAERDVAAVNVTRIGFDFEADFFKSAKVATLQYLRNKLGFPVHVQEDVPKSTIGYHV